MMRRGPGVHAVATTTILTGILVSLILVLFGSRSLALAPAARSSCWREAHHHPLPSGPFQWQRSLLSSGGDGDDRDVLVEEEEEKDTATTTTTTTHHDDVVEQHRPPPPSISTTSALHTAQLSAIATLLKETNRRMDKHQEQMDRLIPLLEALVANQEERKGTTDRATSGARNQQQQQNQRAVLFIDGTWLYYSIYEREMEFCPFARLYGRSWALRYDINWEELLRVVSRELGETISRACVFTSYKSDTSPNSFRYKMFEAMKSSAGYDVYMMETVGRSEKCVDIQLATEVLQSSCDIAVILTGDKDFLPAMIRARKNKKLALVSMRRSCNKALYDTTTALDFDVCWLDNYAEQLVTPKDNLISVFTICKILFDYIQESPVSDRVSSRDAGRYLKFVRIGSMNLGEQVKLYGGLRMFLAILCNIFYVDDDTFTTRGDPNDQSYWIGLQSGAEAQLLFEAKQTTFTPEEKQFFDDSYSLTRLENKNRAYGHSLLLLRRGGGMTSARPQEVHQSDSNDVELPDDLKQDYSMLTVPELKELCRERGLPVSGVKAALLERVEADVRKQIKASKPTKVQQLTQGLPPSVPEDVANYLESLVVEYVKASGGSANSRDVGRYLAANKSSTGDNRMTALQELKSNYGGGLAYFLQQRSEVLEKSDDPLPEEEGIYAFTIRLVEGGA